MKVQTEQKCRVCDCIDDDCMHCIEKTGSPCYWVENDLCSACVTSGEELVNEVFFEKQIEGLFL